MSANPRPEQVSKIVRAALAQTDAAQEHGLKSPEHERALAVQHAACRAASDAEVQAALKALWEREPEA